MSFITQASGVAFATAVGVALSLAVTAQPANASHIDPICGYDVYKGVTYVYSLSARGRVTVAFKETSHTSSLVGRKQIKPDQLRTFPSPHHEVTSNDDVHVWVTRGNRLLGYCEPA